MYIALKKNAKRILHESREKERIYNEFRSNK